MNSVFARYHELSKHQYSWYSEKKNNVVYWCLNSVTTPPKKNTGSSSDSSCLKKMNGTYFHARVNNKRLDYVKALQVLTTKQRDREMSNNGFGTNRVHATLHFSMFCN